MIMNKIWKLSKGCGRERGNKESYWSGLIASNHVTWQDLSYHSIIMITPQSHGLTSINFKESSGLVVATLYIVQYRRG
jgi:hypothetical protein